MTVNTNLGRFLNNEFIKSSVEIEVENVIYNDFKSLSISKQIDSVVSTFFVIFTFDTFDNFPIKSQNEITIYFDRVPVITGFIDAVNNDTGNSDVEISGFSKTIDIVKSSSEKPVTFQPSVQLRDIIFKLLDRNGIPTKNIKQSDAPRGKKEGFIGIIDLAEPKEFVSGDIIEGEIGESLWDIMNKYAEKRQVLITQDGYGNLVITRASKNKAETPLIYNHISQSPDLDSIIQKDITSENNILSASISKDLSDRYYKYIVKTQGNLIGIVSGGGSVDAESLTNQEGIAFDEEIRKSRVLVIPFDTSNNSQTAKERAKWEANIRKSRGFNYTCTIQGFKISESDESIIDTNFLVYVKDQRRSLDSLMLIKSIDYNFSLDSGSTSTLTLVYPNSFTLEIEQNEIESRVNKVGFDI